MASSRKKVVIRKLSRDWMTGYVSTEQLVRKGHVELLGLDGKVTAVAVQDMKWLCYVRDFNSGEPGNPERLVRKTFSARPRTEGLWLRLRLKDNDTVEGLAANDLTLLEGDGILLTPPDTRSNTQRLFIPRTSIAEAEVVAVIGPPAKRKAAAPTAQEDLFSAPPPSLE